MLSEWLMFRDPTLFIIEIVVILLSIALHEFGHAFVADRLGDDTPRRQGRLTLWPDKHFEVVGLVMIVVTTNLGRGLGWGKPVITNPRNFRNPRRDLMLVALGGPAVNLVLAALAGLGLRALPASADLAAVSGAFRIAIEFLMYGAIINLSLLFFNLIPIHPLDGGKVLSAMLPARTAEKFDQFCYQFGGMAIMGLAFLAPGVLGFLIGPPVLAMFRALSGLPA